MRLLFRWFQRVALGLATLGLLLIGTYWASVLVKSSLHHKAVTEFDQEVERATSAIDKRLGLYLGALQGIQGFFGAAEVVDRAEFVSYLQQIELTRRYPRMVGVRYVQRVPQQYKEAFLQGVRYDVWQQPGGYPEFAIHPEAAKNEYFIVKFAEPFLKGDPVLGFDVSSDAQRWKVYLQACDTGLAAASGRLTLLRDVGHARPGFEIALPIYKSGWSHATLSERRACVTGFIAGAFRLDELLSDIFEVSTVSREVDVEIFDGTRPSAQTLLFDLKPEILHALIPSPLSFSQQVALDVAGRTWTIVFDAPQGFGLTPVEEQLPFDTLLFGTIISVLVCTIIFALDTAQGRAVKIAERMTADLRESEERFRTFMDNSAAVAFLKDPEGRYVYANRVFEVTFHLNTVSEWLGKTDFELWPGYASALREHDDFVLTTSETIQREEVLPTPDGKVCQWLVFKFLVPDVLGRRLLGGMAIDITEQKRTEEALRDANEKLHTKMQELERLNRIMLDREERILELKQEIQLLQHRGIPSHG